MRIVNLMEDTEGCAGCIYEHGLSFYIETAHHKILCDTGASDAFLENAKMLGIDLKQVDIVILSHGHYDHTGGVLAFAKMNPNAKIYMQKSAERDYYNRYGDVEKYIGIDKNILELPNLILLEGDLEIDDELSIFSGISGRKYWAKSNLYLKEKVNDTYVQDEFAHEQCLVIREKEKCILVSGCAHNGILNILEKYQELYDTPPTLVISGFHMMKKTPYEPEDIKIIECTARELQQMDTVFYTGHCTGKPAYDIMKNVMGVQLQEIHSGTVIPMDEK